MILTDVISEGSDNQKPARKVKQAGADAQGGAAPVPGDAPQGSVPETLGQKQDRHNGQPNENSQQNPSPNQWMTPSTMSYQSSTRGVRLLCGLLTP